MNNISWCYIVNILAVDTKKKALCMATTTTTTDKYLAKCKVTKCHVKSHKPIKIISLIFLVECVLWACRKWLLSITKNVWYRIFKKQTKPNVYSLQMFYMCVFVAPWIWISLRHFTSLSLALFIKSFPPFSVLSSDLRPENPKSIRLFDVLKWNVYGAKCKVFLL